MNFKNQNSFAIFYIQFIKQFSTGYKQVFDILFSTCQHGNVKKLNLALRLFYDTVDLRLVVIDRLDVLFYLVDRGDDG